MLTAPTPSKIRRGFSTRAIWSGQEPCTATGATIVPVYQTATFTLPEVGLSKGFDYSRSGNPTRLAMERQIAALEDGVRASAFASGMAAVAGAVSLLRCGDHLLATRDIYGGTHRLFTQVLPCYGIDVTFVDTTDVDATWAQMRPNTRMLWLETPSNPALTLCDIAELARTKPRGVLVAVDNTFASPFLQRPLTLGADLVVHSTTKYICGHSDVVGGAVIAADDAIGERVAFHQNCVGAVPGPWDAYLTLRGAKTLALRMLAHSRNAQRVAEFLEGHDDVAEVRYPGLPAHPQHELAKRQMYGFGGIVTFAIKGTLDDTSRFVDACRIPRIAPSLGGVESLIEQPALMSYFELSTEQREAVGITDDLVRYAVGLEDTDELIADVLAALDSSAR